jgi:hypothetical protein
VARVARCITIPLLLPSVFSVAVLVRAAESSNFLPAISVNYPSWKGDRFINLTLDGFPQRKLSVTDHGASFEITGIMLDDFLSRAGWNHLPHGQVSSYVVHVEGSDAAQASFPLTDQHVWLVVEPAPPGHTGAALVILNEHGVVQQRVRGIRRIRVARTGD